MAILSGESQAPKATREPPHVPEKAALFVRTLIPSHAVTRTISCCMLPPHALPPSHATPSSPPSLRSCRQLLVATDNAVELFALQHDTLSLISLTKHSFFTRIFDIAAVCSPVPGRDVLVVLQDNSTLSFMHFDERASCLRSAEQVTLGPLSQLHTQHAVRFTARLLVTHPRKRIVAVASLQSVISVFPLLFLPKKVNAGKVATVHVDGIILSIDFLEDDDSFTNEAILVALLQKGIHQVIAIYTVGVPRDSFGGLSINYVSSMITCASHPDDVAVARATSPITGLSRRPTPPASAITRLAGCPYLFSVFVEGKIIAGDVRSVVLNAHTPDPSTPSPSHQRPNSFHQNDSRIGLRPTVAADESSPPNEDDNLQVSNSSKLSVSSTSTRNPMRNPNLRVVESPAMNFARRNSRAQWREGLPLPTPIPVPMRRTLQSEYPYTGQGESGLDDDYLSYLFVPAYITLEVGDSNGNATAWADAKDHFCDDGGDGNGLYFVMESGAMFVLRWGETARKGVVSFRIPGTSPNRNFSVEFVGDVGPAVSVSSLDKKLIFVANDAADGSLRQLRLPPTDDSENISRTRLRSRGGPNSSMANYSLDVRQHFLNMSPITDFIITPPKRERIAARFRKELAVFQKSLCAGNLELEKIIRNLTLTDPKLLMKKLGGQQNALDDVMYGCPDESEIIACTGTGRQGCLRMIRPGAPVSVLAASASSFPACNDIWPIRFTIDAKHDAGLVLTFAQDTRLLLAVLPRTISEMTLMDSNQNPGVAHLVDGTEAVGIISGLRTIELGVVENGVLAQIHEEGIRFIFLKKANEIDLEGKISESTVRERLYDRTVDWQPPEAGFISVGTIGAGFILISLLRSKGLKPLLYLLKCFPSEANRTFCVVSKAELDNEPSCIKIPEWTRIHSEREISSPRLPPMVFIGTYAPSIEVRLLGPTLELIDCRTTRPWDIRMDPNENQSKLFPSAAPDRRNVNEAFSSHRSTPSQDEDRSKTETSKRRTYLMTAVPETLCAVEIDQRTLLFAGLRDGSVMCFSFGEDDDIDAIPPDSPSAAGHLCVEMHRKLGYRPVVVKAAVTAIGRVILCQAERPWMCTSQGGSKLRWTPLAFPETNALCSFSVLGAERCFTTIAKDGAMYICTLRQNSQVSVRTLLIGSTPRRVIEAPRMPNCVVVATTREHGAVHDLHQQGTLPQSNLAAVSEFSQLIVYNKRTRMRLGHLSLLTGELVHVLMRWNDFIIVGTSWGIRDQGAHKKCERGRLLIYSLRPAKHRSPSEQRTGKVRFRKCTKVVLPGAILAGAVHPTADMFAVSCNEDILLFSIVPSIMTVVEIGRASVRTLVVSLSITKDMLCAVDRKDSVSFFQIHTSSEMLVRDRSDHRKRIVSDAVLMSRSHMVGVDRLGALFSLSYEDGDAPRFAPYLRPDGVVSSPHVDMFISFRSQEEMKKNAVGSRAPITAAADSDEDEFGIRADSEMNIDKDEEESDESSSDDADQEARNIEVEIDDLSQRMNECLEEMEKDFGSLLRALNSKKGSSDEIGSSAEPASGSATVSKMDEEVLDESTVEGAQNVSDVESNDPEDDSRLLGVPRNLVCYHSFNLNDIVLRLRVGSFSRSEKVKEIEEFRGEAGCLSTIASQDFFDKSSRTILCGTVGGAILSAVSMSSESYELMSKVESELSKHVDVSGRNLGSTHEKFRSAYGSRALCCVDGDLLDQFDDLRRSAKREIATRVGCPGERGVLRIEGTIRDLFDRVA